MVFFSGIRTKLHDYYLSKALKNNKAVHQSVNFSIAKSVGILFDATELSDRDTILSFANQLKKRREKYKVIRLF